MSHDHPDLAYLSPAWFTAVSELLPGRDRPDLVVTHELRRGRGMLVHTQAFAGGRLIGWHPGADLLAELIISRTASLDAGDLLARIDPDLVAAATTVSLPCQPSWPSNVWGVGPLLARRIPCAPPDLTIDVTLTVTGTPFGDVTATLGLRGSELIVVADPTGDLEHRRVQVTSAYDVVLDWLHDPAGTTRQLLWTGAIEGDIFRISALSGVVESSADPPVEAWQRTFHRVVSRYATARAHPASVEVLDQIDELTAPAGDPVDPVPGEADERRQPSR